MAKAGLAIERPKQLVIEGKAPSAWSRVAKYFLVRSVLLAVMVIIGVFLAIVFINFGGFIDQIYRANVEESIAVMALGMEHLPIQEKAAVLEQARQSMLDAYGLNQPFLLRCLQWLYRGLTFNWGAADFVTSSSYSNNLQQVILEHLPYTLLLAGAANVLLFFASVFTALVLSRRYNSRLDRIMVLLSPLSSAPNWVYGILLVAVFAAELGILPYGGLYDERPPGIQLGYILVLARHMLLPVTAIFLSTFFQSVYVWRTFFLVHSEEDYVELAHAKGLPERWIERKYILRPALPYLITSFALLLLGFWQGAIALEKFFNWPGIGLLFIDSVWILERRVLIALIVVFAYLLALSVLILDIIYALVDPRVKIGGDSTAGQTTGKVVQSLGRRRAARRSAPLRAVPGSPGQASPAGAWRSAAEGLKSFTASLKRIQLRPILRTIRRSPTILIGLFIVLGLVGMSIYTVIAIPYEAAVALWRENPAAWLRNPENAPPAWTNLFRKNDLPPTLIFDSRNSSPDSPVTKEVKVITSEMTEAKVTFPIDYSYPGGYPQDLMLNFKASYTEKKPFIILAWRTPDGREIELEQFSATSDMTYSFNREFREKQFNPFKGQGGNPVASLFVDPQSEPPVPGTGQYQLQVTGYTFEPEAKLEVELVLHGQVHGWFGTDSNRRDLSVALLWGTPVALAFGFLGAIATTITTMVIAALGAWQGGWVDALIQRITEINMLLPALPIAIMVYYVYSKSVWAILGVMVLLSIFSSQIKNYRAMFLQIKDSAYIEAARMYGAGSGRIILRYLVPRILPVLIPQIVSLVPSYVFLEATLAYLGVSDIYLPTWGKVVSEALTIGALRGNYHWILEPIGLLMATGLGFVMLGFSLDRILNPRLRAL